MSGHICVSVSKNCYAGTWSYGEICVHCNCCGRYSKGLDMWLARLRYHEQGLEEGRAFKDFVEPFTELQKKNKALNIAWQKRKIKKCEERIEYFVRKELSL